MMKGSRKKKQNQLYSMSEKTIASKGRQVPVTAMAIKQTNGDGVACTKVKSNNSVRQKTIKGGRKKQNQPVQCGKNSCWQSLLVTTPGSSWTNNDACGMS